jgi:hypothetical protein
MLSLGASLSRPVIFISASTLLFWASLMARTAAMRSSVFMSSGLMESTKRSSFCADFWAFVRTLSVISSSVSARLKSSSRRSADEGRTSGSTLGSRLKPSSSARLRYSSMRLMR